MLKLLICLVCGLLIAIVMLQLRLESVQLGHRNNQLHSQIKEQQAKLWSQQLQIATYTAPNAISRTIDNQGLNLAAPAGLPSVAGEWAGPPGGAGATTTDRPADSGRP